MRNNELGWKIAIGALTALEALAVSVLLALRADIDNLRSDVREQGKHISNIEGRMGLGSSGTNSTWYFVERK